MRAESRGLAGRSAMLVGGKFEVEEIGAHAESAGEIAFDDRPQPIAQPVHRGIPAPAVVLQTITCGSGAIGNGTSLLSRS